MCSSPLLTVWTMAGVGWLRCSTWSHWQTSRQRCCSTSLRWVPFISIAITKHRSGHSSLAHEAELEAVLKKMNSDKMEYEQKLKRQAQLLDTKAAKINKLEGIYSSRLKLLQWQQQFILFPWESHDPTDVRFIVPTGTLVWGTKQNTKHQLIK